jgi:hypothetical protein
MRRKYEYQLTDGEPTSRRGWMIRETPARGEEEALMELFPQMVQAISANLDRSMSLLGSLEQKLADLQR